MDEPISEAVKAVLAYMRNRNPDAVIPAESASLMFCGVEDTRLDALSDFELMQVAIFQYAKLTTQLQATVQLLRGMATTTPRLNRFSRRHH